MKLSIRSVTRASVVAAFLGIPLDIVPSSGRDTKSHVLSGLGSDPRLRLVPSACP